MQAVHSLVGRSFSNARSLVDACSPRFSCCCWCSGLCTGSACFDHCKRWKGAPALGQVLFLVHGRCVFHGACDGSLAPSSISRLSCRLQFLRGFRSVPCARAKGRIEGGTGRPHARLGGGHPMPRRQCCACVAGSDPAATRPKPEDSIHRFWIGRCAHFRGRHTALHPSAHGQDVLVVRSFTGHDRQLYCSLDRFLPGHSWPAPAWRLVAVAASDINRSAGDLCHKSLLSAEVSFKAGCAAGLGGETSPLHSLTRK